MPPWYPMMGEHELSIDDKGRLLIPVDIRKRFEAFGENDFLVLVNMGGKPFLYPEKYHLSRYGNIKIGIVPSLKEQKLLRAVFGSNCRLQWDKQGRILLSPKSVGNFKLDRDKIVLVCAGDHLELWNRSDWELEQAQLATELPSIIESMEARLGPENN